MTRSPLFAASTFSWTLSLALHAGAIVAIWQWGAIWNVDRAAELVGKSGTNTITVEMALVERANSESPVAVEFSDRQSQEWVAPSARPQKSETVHTSQRDLQHPVAAEAPSVEIAPVLVRAESPSDQLSTAIDQPQVDHVPRRPAQSASPQLPSVTAEAGVTSTTDPQFYRNLPPVYPPEAQARGWQGTVLLRLEISAAGNVSAVHVERGSGHAILDRAAVEVVRLWRARPATRGGQPVSTTEYQPVIFRLR